jgi:3-oxoacyl-(acyl-carrier-protein) synthase/NADP-dependent 3-hydroxy acid dehydrogenase YdfG/acyl carrier protein
LKQRLFYGLSGLLKSAHAENPKFVGQIIEVELTETAQGIAEKLRECGSNPEDSLVSYRCGKRYVGAWVETIVPQTIGRPWKDKGVYLITGGAGGLGLIFAREIARSVKDAVLILTGRSVLEENKKLQLDELKASGTRVVYRQVDVADREEIYSLMEGIKEDFGGLNGIIHSAGVIKDNYIIKKTADEFSEVLLPKVEGLVNLDMASSSMELDFMVAFSSISGSLGSVGQADYSTANAFMDAYALYRNTLTGTGERHGKTLSINWPLWKSGGMHVDEETEKTMRESAGLIPMSTETGIQAFYKAMASGKSQVMVLEGETARIRFLTNTCEAEKETNIKDYYAKEEINADSLQDDVKSILKEQLAALLGVNDSDIDCETDFEDYGMDAVKLAELADRLSSHYKAELDAGMFYQYPNVNSAAHYITKEYSDMLKEKVEVKNSANTSAGRENQRDRQTCDTITTEDQSKVKADIYNSVDIPELRQKVLYKVKSVFGEVTDLSVDRIDEGELLESYGIDSIMITRLNRKFGDIFRDLSKTIFYEYNTLGALTEYLITGYRDECMAWTGLAAEEAAVSGENTAEPLCSSNIPGLVSFKKTRKLKRGFTAVNSKTKAFEPVAIIGISGRFPKAQNLKEYWDNLKNGKDCITEIHSERWAIENFYHPDPEEAVQLGKSYCKWGGFVDGFADFDPLFFNISPKDAVNMDPQERLFIEACWEVMEDAGYTREQIARQYNGRVGIFAGITKTGFDLYGPDLWRQGDTQFPFTSFGSVANRISYLMNLSGPSMPVDTMCSSSLTAVHEACEHINRGECEMAVAGGVNLYLHPTSYIALCTQNMLSRDGACKSFGKGGNGFVPGEGVGAVLLKTLSKAIEDGDHIYAVIRGTSVNHGGKTSGYTVPSPAAQGEVIRAALDKAGINARTVSYIEAHGTGTELGDPIEISGLSRAFEKDTRDTCYCAIGSAKSNIGHLEAAAGIAGLIKAVLQMKHGKLVPSLHSEELNPNINFEKTPFIVNRELREWKRPVVNIDGETVEYPRIAGISSFGAGGVNAHVVIEEYVKEDVKPEIKITPKNPAIIVLSAKSEEQLKVQAERLLAVVKDQLFENDVLADIAYTLQVGREAMDERLGMTVCSIKELEEKLEKFLKDIPNVEGLYRGQVKRNKEILVAFKADEAAKEIIDSWINNGNYTKILDIWTKGLNFDWNKLYGDIKPDRISLPTYPFAKERYWIPAIKSGIAAKSPEPSGKAYIHPLLHENTSDLTGQRFSSVFTGEESFILNHASGGSKTLPALVQLEMARAAVQKGAGALLADSKEIRIRNMVWSRPVVIEDRAEEIHLGLYLHKNGEIAFEIYRESEIGNIEVFSQGSAYIGSASKVAAVNIDVLSKNCGKRRLSSVQTCEILRSNGFIIDSRYQSAGQIDMGNREALVKLPLPVHTGDNGNFIMHPDLMEEVYRALAVLMVDNYGLKPVQILSLQELEVFSGLDSVIWAWIRSTEENNCIRFDIDFCNEQGTIGARLTGLVLKGRKMGQFYRQQLKLLAVSCSRPKW